MNTKLSKSSDRAALGSSDSVGSVGGQSAAPVDPIRSTDHDTLTLELRIVPTPEGVHSANPFISFREPIHGTLKMLLLRRSRMWLVIARSGDADDDI